MSIDALRYYLSLLTCRPFLEMSRGENKKKKNLSGDKETIIKVCIIP